MGMAFSVLASGSTGNAMYVETSKTRLLIDAGLTGKKIEKMFAQIDRSIADIDGVLVTHEHSDHVKGVGVLARKYQIPVYANEKTWKRMAEDLGPVDTSQCFHIETGGVYPFSDLDVETFAVSHDAVDPMFFVFHHENKKIALATDMGYVSQHIKGVLADADALIFEANHDMNMLRMGRYPWNVKRRILGDTGHVSNDDAAKALTSIIGDRTRYVYLAHLSQDNNLKQLARMTVEQTLGTYEFDCTTNGVQIRDTDPYMPTPIQKLM
ncbi:MBL fold metallo-hydrolase [Natribacillus halophilus]|uniref:Phosphoribosyl 1,2-cyclic phosphodiesterase n=1 Tax=Natribacillus halophilus TaxID=549003 RepID=A0A1G8L0W5_9BACI|nr:MBL fold metallo-hydrolase [Natribacillus halophilus]SDI49227.1 Phosphoribosyl 1,2-cyclic phosphodiesterase [Natribacillus halophilus]